MDTQKIKEYLYGNLASIFWSLFLLTGGGIFISYYAHIEYMPDFDFKSSITLLSAASVTAIFIVLLLLSILIFPGVYWTNWANTTQLKKYWEDDEGNKELLKTTLYFGAPIMFCYGLFFIWYQYGVFAILLYTATGTFFCYILLSKTDLCGKELWKELGKIAFTSLFCFVLTLVPLNIVLSLAASTPITSKGDRIFISLVVALFIAFANIMAVAKPPKMNGFLWYPGLGLITLFVLVSAFEVTYRIPERVMEIYKFGSIHTKLIVFKSI